MVKSLKWKKKAALIALAGTIGMSFSGCKNVENEEVAITKEAFTAISENQEEMNEWIETENSNGEWNKYKSLVTTTYTLDGKEKRYVLIAGLEMQSKYKNLYRCLTIPEFYLEETIDEKTFTSSYRLIPAKGIEEEYTKRTEVVNVNVLEGITNCSFDEIQKMEEILTTEENAKIDNELGR